jgi:UTP--glucose-1-phosphate uridylyltransferase
MVKKAVISCAGLGTRFLPVVKAFQKELVPILDKPNIQYAVEECVGAGIEEIALVVRPGNIQTKKYFTPDDELAKSLESIGKSAYLDSLKSIWAKVKRLEFFEQDPKLPYGNGTPVLVCKEFIGNENFAYLFGDDFILEENTGSVLADLINVFEKYQAAAIELVQKVPESEFNRYGMVEYKKESGVPNQMESIIEKPEISQAPSDMAQVGRFVCTSKVINELENQPLGKGNELWFADMMNTLSHKDIVIAEPIKTGVWSTTGDPLRWLETNIAKALQDNRYSADLKIFLRELR